MKLFYLGRCGSRATVNFNDEMGITRRENIGSQTAARSFESECIRNLQRRREMPRIENSLNSCCSHRKLWENSSEHRPAGWLRDQAKGGFGDNAQKPFGARESPDQVKARLVFMQAAASTEDFATGQHHFQAEHIAASDSVFQTAWTTRIGRDVAADGAILQRGRVGRIFPSHGVGGLLQSLGDHSRLHNGDTILRVNADDLVHARRR